MNFENNYINNENKMDRSKFTAAVKRMLDAKASWDRIELYVLFHCRGNWRDPKVQALVKEHDARFGGKGDVVTEAIITSERSKSWKYIEDFEKTCTTDADRQVLESMIDKHFERFNPAVYQQRLKAREQAH